MTKPRPRLVQEAVGRLGPAAQVPRMLPSHCRGSAPGRVCRPAASGSLLQPARQPPGVPSVAVGVPTVAAPDGRSATSLFFCAVVLDAREVPALPAEPALSGCCVLPCPSCWWGVPCLACWPGGFLCGWMAAGRRQLCLASAWPAAPLQLGSQRPACCLPRITTQIEYRAG